MRDPIPHAVPMRPPTDMRSQRMSPTHMRSQCNPLPHPAPVCVTLSMQHSPTHDPCACHPPTHSPDAWSACTLLFPAPLCPLPRCLGTVLPSVASLLHGAPLWTLTLLRTFWVWGCWKDCPFLARDVCPVHVRLDFQRINGADELTHPQARSCSVGAGPVKRQEWERKGGRKRDHRKVR